MKEKEVGGGDLDSEEHLDIWEGEEMLLTNGLEKALTATNTLFPDSIFIFQVYLYF